MLGPHNREHGSGLHERGQLHTQGERDPDPVGGLCGQITVSLSHEDPDPVGGLCGQITVKLSFEDPDPVGGLCGQITVSLSLEDGVRGVCRQVTVNYRFKIQDQ